MWQFGDNELAKSGERPMSVRWYLYSPLVVREPEGASA